MTTLEFIGQIGVRDYSEFYGDHGADVAAEDIAMAAALHEQAGFDRVLVAARSTWPDPLVVAAHAARSTERLGFMIAHRPGVMMPTTAARQFATLNRLIGARVAVHIVVGGEDAEAQRDGDFLPKAQRYERAGEYIKVMRACWSSGASFSFEGKNYRFCDVKAGFMPGNTSRITVYSGGASDEAIAMAAAHVDIFALWGESRSEVQGLVERARGAARAAGRRLEFSISFRPILAASETAAWERAEQIKADALAIAQAVNFSARGEPKSTGSQRLLKAAARGERLDERVWTGFASISGARGNAMALVGTPGQVAETILSYVDLGITTFILRGFDLCADATLFGEELIPLVRQMAAQRVACVA